MLPPGHLLTTYYLTFETGALNIKSHYLHVFASVLRRLPVVSATWTEELTWRSCPGRDRDTDRRIMVEVPVIIDARRHSEVIHMPDKRANRKLTHYSPPLLAISLP